MSTEPAPQKRPSYEPGARLLKPTGYDPDMPRPTTIVAGTILVILRVIAGIVVLIGLAAEWQSVASSSEAAIDGVDSADAVQIGLWIILIAGIVVLVVDSVLATFIYRGRNWARVIMMTVTVLSISTSFVAWWAQGQEVSLQSTFLSLALDILILLALSSRTAAAYARRNEKP